MRSRQRLSPAIDLIERRRRPPIACPAVEEMRADRVGHHQLPVPRRGHRIGVIMRRQSDRRKDIAGERLARDPQRLVPPLSRRQARHRPVAGEAELAAGRPLGSLIDHAANRVRKRRVHHAVQHDLRHRPLAVIGFGRRLIIDRACQALQRTAAIRGACPRHRKGTRGMDRAVIHVEACARRNGQIGQGGGAGAALRRRGIRIGRIIAARRAAILGSDKSLGRHIGDDRRFSCGDRAQCGVRRNAQADHGQADREGQFANLTARGDAHAHARVHSRSQPRRMPPISACLAVGRSRPTVRLAPAYFSDGLSRSSALASITSRSG